MATSPITNHPAQLEIWRDPARFKVLVIGRRWGKTFLLREMMLKASETPRSDIVYIAPTRQQAKDVMWQALKDRASELGWKYWTNESELKVKRRNKSTIQLVSAEKPGRLRGRGLSFAALDEYAEYRTAEIWNEVVRPALSDRRGQAVFAATPKGMNHLYELYQAGKVEQNWSSWSFTTLDSPFFQTPEGRAEIEEAKRNLSERDFKQEYEASFESFSGRIYHAFDRGKVHDDRGFDPNLPIIIGQDFNRSPMSSAIYQRHKDALVQIDELFLHYSNTEEVCRVIKDRYPGVSGFFRPDATGSRKTSNSSRSDHEIIRSYGFLVQTGASNPKRVDRWAAVNRAFEKGLVKINTKKCTHTVKDLETLVYKEGTCEPDVRDPMAGHMADAVGYAVYKEFPIHGGLVVSSYA